MVSLHPKRLPGRQLPEVAEHTRCTIIVAALPIFAKEGFAAASIREIASAAGTTHGMLRHHFGSKEGVWQAVVDQVIAEYVLILKPLVIEATQIQRDPLYCLMRAVRAYLELSAERPDTVRLMLFETAQGPRLEYVLHQLEPLCDLMAPLFQRVQQEGYLRQFDNRTFFFYLLTAGAAPFAHAAFSEWFVGANILEMSERERHITRILSTLLGSETLLRYATKETLRS
jgi:AcrR family transcriptional regulator